MNEPKLTLKQIYIRALAENLSAKEAGAKYGCNYISLLNRGPENGLPPLATEWKRQDQRNLRAMSIDKLKNLKSKLDCWSELCTITINEKEPKTDGTNLGS